MDEEAGVVACNRTKSHRVQAPDAATGAQCSRTHSATVPPCTAGYQAMELQLWPWLPGLRKH